jgi:serine/threonine protein kinase
MISDNFKDSINRTSILQELKCKYILGAGAYSIVLAGIYNNKSAAIKIITSSTYCRNEVNLLKGLYHKNINTILDEYINDDIICLIQPIFGTNWVEYSQAISNKFIVPSKLELKFSNIMLTGYSGSCDLWAWKIFEQIRYSIHQSTQLSYANRVNSICTQVLSALNYLHNNNITHGDIKAENILAQTLTSKYDISSTFEYNIYVRICDFGYVNIKTKTDDMNSYLKLLKYLSKDILE